MDRNLRLYPVYQATRHLLFWIPVFFLYFQAHLPADRVLLLESIYYLAVVLLEVPSGWFSDRVSRRLTLIVSATAATGAYAAFALASSFPVFVVAQVLLAASMAFNSGTDSSLLYDSLTALGRGDELVAIESRAVTGSFIAYGLAALAGGAIAGVDLGLAYVLSAAGGAACLVTALFLREPPRSSEAPTGSNLREAFGRLRVPALGWTFAFAVGMTVFEHVPYMFVQPWLEALLGSGHGYHATPAVAGGLAFVTTGLGALASTRTVALRGWLGEGATLIVCLIVYVILAGAMATAVHPVVAALLALRSVPQGIAGPVMSGVIHPRLPSRVRATYLSIQSLAGRLAFSATLALAALAVGPVDSLGPDELRPVLLGYAAANLALVVALAVTIRAIRGRAP